MFTSKGFFSEVACPYQSTCLLPKCLFWHPEVSVEADSRVVHGNEIDVRAQGDRPAKRQKIEEGFPNFKDAERVVPKYKSGTLGGGNLKVSQALKPSSAQEVLSVDRPISPPPLRRKNQLPTTPATRNREMTTSLKPSGATSISTPSPAVKLTPNKAPLKEEVLHPRPLKGPLPSTFAIRYKLIQLLHEQFTRLNSELKNDANEEEEKLLLSDQELIKKTLDLEEDAACTQSIYSNIVKGKIGVYKKMTVPQWKDERAREIAALKVPKESNSAAKPQGPKIIETGLTPEEEIQILPRLYSPLTGLENHGYVTTIPTDSDIRSAREGIEAAKGWEQCDRCKSRFQVFPGRREEDGALTSGGACTYHYGKARFADRSPSDPKGKREKRYGCCNQLLGDSPGCTKADCHVFKITEVKRLASVLNFEKTPHNPERTSLQPVCIDGEMGYTVYGLELIRLTATSWPRGEELFDVLVRPVGEIMDLNSRFSGVWPKDYAEAAPWDTGPEPLISPSSPPHATLSPEGEKTLALTKRKLRMVSSPTAARSLLFSYLSPETPLIGHGLENDMNATRIIHQTIIDTALLFPHPQGLPYRNGLKALMLRHLNRHIQVVVDGKMEGHDSMEDANAAGELVRVSLANNWSAMKREGWTFNDGMLTRPSSDSLADIPTGPKAGRKRTFGEVELEDGELDS